MMSMILMTGSLMTMIELSRHFANLGKLYSDLNQEVGILREKVAFLE
ncbi:MAG: hypothetical protein NW237_03875 [Cyanobacteriota bacterium]|nr:hypothetical protein [Cyanobacteriota bacterium]